MGIPVDSLARITGTWTDPTGALIDPATISLITLDPNGAKTTYNYPASVVRASLGVYRMDVDTTGRSGLWLFEWKSTGTGQAALLGEFTVDPSPLG